MDKEKLENCECGSCGCGCEGNDNECGEGHEALMVDLEDENGDAVSCEVVDGFRYKDNDYALVQNPENESVYLFKIIGEGDEGELVVPDDKEFDEVSKYYEELLEQQ